MVSSDDHIEDLTIKIKEEVPHYLATVERNDLNLWKLYKPRPSREVTRTGFLTTVKLLHEFSEDKDEDETAARLLDPTDKISSEGPWPTRKIHVLVEVPPDHSRYEYRESSSSPLRW
jgi:Crinkler effector protein N-terminal domain